MNFYETTYSDATFHADSKYRIVKDIKITSYAEKKFATLRIQKLKKKCVRIHFISCSLTGVQISLISVYVCVCVCVCIYICINEMGGACGT